MATKGQSFNKSSFSTSWSHSFEDSHSNKDQYRYVFVCSACWYLECHAEKAGLLGTEYGSVQVYCDVWDGSKWIENCHLETSASGGTRSYYIGQHYVGSRGSIGTYTDSAYPLWRIRYWPSRSNSNWYLKIWTGSWGVSSNGYPTGQPIKSIGTNGSSIYNAGTSNNESYARGTVFNPNNRKGSIIYGAYDHELVYYPYAT